MTRSARRRILRYTITDLSRSEVRARLADPPAKAGPVLIERQSTGTAGR